MAGTPHIVSDVMTMAVVAVGRDAPFREIVRTMEQWKVSGLPVLEGDGRVIGVVSEADVLAKEEFRAGVPSLSEPRERLSATAKAGGPTAGDLMTTPAITVHPDVTLAQAARIMAVKHIKRLPVVDDEGMLRGIVSRADLLKVFLRSDEDLEEEVRRIVIAPLFPALAHTIHADVRDGVVTLRGRIADSPLISLAARLTRAVEGVVDVECDLTEARSAGAEPTDRPTPAVDRGHSSV
ncbi:CBS domain-containing protein [Streptomyces cynarae]|uniref:CBS domain-containing protein n=1 Tax=Streptomyces cynarae TaxID=2981134 RepID=A0ABY6ECA2_9ACTN|nr:CBS domain-containing protein [Streptomyces cynarae]UXY23528.1 CBS domain-containing protein [Streptomyces cynarae]